MLAGVDEVGRGPLAGPVVACAVIMPPDVRAIRGVDDSKQLTRAERERLAALIRVRALALSLGAASAREIDRLNVFHATVLAMRRALARLPITPHYVVVDGNPLRTLGVPHHAVVGGDARCYNIACASIVAKVTRDRVMRALGARYPVYAWVDNVGYATEAHLDGIERHGICRHHRLNFRSVAQTVLALGVGDLELRDPLDAGDMTDPRLTEPDLVQREAIEVRGAAVDRVELGGVEFRGGPP